MRKLFYTLGVATALALSSTAANAAAIIIQPNPLIPPASVFFGNATPPAGSLTTGNFMDTFAFTIGGTSSALTNAQVGTLLLDGAQNVSFLATANCPLCGIWLDTMDVAHKFTQTQFDPKAESWELDPAVILAAGTTHNIIVNGTLIGPTGAYSGTLNLQPRAVAVPEPATWGMMLVGFAGVGFALRRRRRPVLAQLA
jgi:hypothetical protein